MKKRRFAQLVLVITMLFCLTFGTVYVQAATTAKAAIKNGWKKEGGQYYYYIGQAKGWHTGVYGNYSYGMDNQIQKTVNFRTGRGN